MYGMENGGNWKRKVKEELVEEEELGVGLEEGSGNGEGEGEGDGDGDGDSEGSSTALTVFTSDLATESSTPHARILGPDASRALTRFVNNASVADRLEDLKRKEIEDEEYRKEVEEKKEKERKAQKNLLQEAKRLANTQARRASQNRNLIRLSPRHRMIIALHLEGLRTSEVAQIIECSIQTVREVLSDPLSQAIIAQAYEAHCMELRSLMGQAVDAVRGALYSNDVKVRLSAVDRFQKMLAFLDDNTSQEGRGGRGGDDPMLPGEVRAKFITEIRRLMPQEGKKEGKEDVIEGECETVTEIME